MLTTLLSARRNYSFSLSIKDTLHVALIGAFFCCFLVLQGCRTGSPSEPIDNHNSDTIKSQGYMIRLSATTATSPFGTKTLNDTAQHNYAVHNPGDSTFELSLVYYADGTTSGMRYTKMGGVSWTISRIGSTPRPGLSVGINPGSYDTLRQSTSLTVSLDSGLSYGSDSYKISVHFKNYNAVDTVINGTLNVIYSQPDNSYWLDVSPSTWIANLNDIDFADSQVGIAVGDSGTILRTIDGGSHWVRALSPVQNKLDRIRFASPTTAYICGDNVILRTLDGGQSWVSTTSISGNFREFQILNDSTLYMYESAILDGNDTLLFSRNGGNSWQYVPTPFGYINNVHAINGQTFVVIETNSASRSDLRVTTDGGTTWTLVPQQFNDVVSHVYYINDLKGIAITSRDHWYETNDGGLSWTTLSHIDDQSTTGPRVADFLADGKGYGANLDVFSYQNGRWTLLANTHFNFTMNGIATLGPEDAVVVGYGYKNGSSTARGGIIYKRYRH